MGLSYTNITLRGPTQAQLVTHLTEMRRKAYVSPTVGNITVVYDQECEDQDYAALMGLTELLSRRFACPALATLLHDDDIFGYGLYRAGEHLDEYDSTPGYFDPESDVLPPSGGDAALLCAAFGREDQVTAVQWHLHKMFEGEEGDGDNDLFPEDRHRGVVEALGFPPFAAGVGFDTISFAYGVDAAEVNYQQQGFAATMSEA